MSFQREKNKKERVRSLFCTVRFDLASYGSYSVQVQGVTDVCYLCLLTNGILASLLE